MSISSNQKITWDDITTAVITAIKSVCCNIDSYSSSVPANLKSGTASNPTVWSYTTTKSDTNYGHNYGSYWGSQTFAFYGNNSTNLISIVTTTTVNSEWNTFLSSAGIYGNDSNGVSSRTNKVIQAKDLGLAIGLCSQFMAYHLKRIHSRRQLLSGTTQSGSTWVTGNGSLFQGTKYVTGTCVPKYTLSGISPSSIPDVTDAEIISTVRQNLVHDGTNYGILDREGDPRLHRVYLN